MATAKRLYLYAVSGVGLTMALAGAAVMIRTLLNNLGVGPQAATARLTSDPDRDLLSLALGLVIAGLAVWLVHWALVERLVQGAENTHLAERRSIVRAVYFVVVLATTLYIAAAMLIQLISKIIADRLEAASTFSMSILSVTDDAWVLAILIVATAAFAYHVWIRDRDLRQTPRIAGAAAWISRFYLYGAAFVGLIAALDEISSIMRTIAGEWAGVRGVSGFDLSQFGNLNPTEGPLWVRPVVIALVGVVVWGAIWLAHWWYSNRMCAAPNAQAEPERTSRVRLTFFAAVVLWGVGVVVAGVVSGFSQLLAALMDVKAAEPTWYLVFVPPATAIPAAVAWWWHRHLALAEEPRGPEGVSATRILIYLTALVGLSSLASGAVLVLETLMLQIFSSAGPDQWKLPVATGVAAVVVGVAIWILPWMAAQARTLSHRATETVSAARAYYLYLVLGSSVAIGATNLVVFVYRYCRLFIGLGETGLGAEVAGPIAVLVVTVALLAYHAMVLHDDQTPRSTVVYVAPVAPGPPENP